MQHNQTQDIILARLKIKELNEIQKATIDASQQHENITLLSATGTGKTLAFLLPLVGQIKPGINKTRAIIIVPSRELALQIESVFKKMGTGLKVSCCYGGHDMETEENNLRQAPAVLIGTPGRLADHIRRGNIGTGSIHAMVLDEFDKSLELGFQDEMSFIIQSLPAIRRRILISATNTIIPGFLGVKDFHQLNFIDTETHESGLELRLVKSEHKDKLETLFRLICTLGSRSTIVFCNHRESVERTSSYLKEQGIVNVFYHGALEQQERESALFKFKSGTVNVLVTTDLAARGLDIHNIRYIVHYHLPGTVEAFIHRNGRTARMNASGTSILVLSPEEKLPLYVNSEIEELTLSAAGNIPDKPVWTALFIAAGKKEKINKVDIVGFFSKQGKLKAEDIGMIEVKDHLSFVAIRKSKLGHTLHLIKDEKIKNKKIRIAIAK